MQPIDIMMTTYFRKDFTRQVIEHILWRTKTPFRFIIVDNGSRDGTREMLQDFQKNWPNQFYKVILLDNNVGLQASKNIGLEFVESDYFINTDNDCLCPQLEPDWLAQMLSLAQKYPEFGAFALRPQILVGVGPIFAAEREIVENNVCGGSFRLMKTDLVKKAGGWEDGFENRHEEWNISGKLKQMGFRVGYAKNLWCYHLFGEGENWGYQPGVEHYHNPKSKIYAKDQEYDPITMEPKLKSNE